MTPEHDEGETTGSLCEYWTIIGCSTVSGRFQPELNFNYHVFHRRLVCVCVLFTAVNWLSAVAAVFYHY